MLRVLAHPSSLGVVRRYIAAIAAEAQIDRRRSYRLCLAVDEIVTNILTHGYGGANPSQAIEVWHWNDASGLHVVVEDTSAAYEPQTDALDRDRIEQGRGGLGLFLARTGVDRFSYERRHGRNHHTFEVARLPLPPRIVPRPAAPSIDAVRSAPAFALPTALPDARPLPVR